MFFEKNESLPLSVGGSSSTKSSASAGHKQIANNYGFSDEVSRALSRLSLDDKQYIMTLTGAFNEEPTPVEDIVEDERASTILRSLRSRSLAYSH